MNKQLIKINKYEYVTQVDGGNIKIKYLTKDHKEAHSINDQYVEIYSKITQKMLKMPLKELQEGLKSEDYGQKLAEMLLKVPFEALN